MPAITQRYSPDIWDGRCDETYLFNTPAPELTEKAGGVCHLLFCSAALARKGIIKVELMEEKWRLQGKKEEKSKARVMDKGFFKKERNKTKLSEYGQKKKKCGRWAVEKYEVGR